MEKTVLEKAMEQTILIWRGTMFDALEQHWKEGTWTSELDYYTCMEMMRKQSRGDRYVFTIELLDTGYLLVY